MKILYISSSKIPSRTANSIHVMKMCSAWATSGHRVVLLAQHEKKYYETSVENIYAFYGVNDNFKIVRVPSFSTNLILAHLYGVLCLCYAIVFKPDIVYGREASGTFWSTVFGYPAIFEVHNPETLKGYYPRKLVRSNGLRYFVVISRKLKELAKDLVGNKQIIVAHDGADSEVIYNSKSIVNEPNLSQYDERFNIGYTGHLYPGKGAEIIVELARRLGDITFHIFGGEEKDIQRLQRDAPGNLVFHGFIPHSVMPLVQKRMDILLLPAQKKVVASGYGKRQKDANISDFMSPLKLFEYMRSGKPIIASDISVLREVLENGRNALLCEPQDVRQWVSAILRVKNSPELSENLARRARNDFLEMYTWKARSEKVLENL